MLAPRSPLLLMLAVACTGEQGPSAVDSAAPADTGPCAGIEPSLEIGEGEEEFEPLEPGAPVVMVHGIQEGWHITGAIRAWQTEQVVRLKYQVDAINFGVTIVDQSYRFALVPTEDGCGGTQPDLTGFISILEITEDKDVLPYEILAYEPLLMRMELDDDHGQVLSAELEVVAALDPQDMDQGDPDGDPEEDP